MVRAHAFRRCAALQSQTGGFHLPRRLRVVSESELAADYADPNINKFDLQLTEVWAQSEEPTIAEQPLDHPSYGTFLDLEEIRPDLVGIQAVTLSGKAQKLSVNSNISPALSFAPDDGSASLTLNPGDVVTVIDHTPLPLHSDGAVPAWRSSHQSRNLRVADTNGRTGTLTARTWELRRRANR